MKLPIILGALLLSSTPAFADDFVYLKCSGTVQWGKFEPSGDNVEETDEIVLHFKIDTKKKLYIDSNNPENLHKVKILNGVVFEQMDFEEGATGHMIAQIAFDPPGKAISKSIIRDNNTADVYTNEFIGNCEASNASAYEASK
jgi:hypothetical protein